MKVGSPASGRPSRELFFLSDHSIHLSSIVQIRRSQRWEGGIEDIFDEFNLRFQIDDCRLN
jgi:hypothetical protein